jgi:hypothetical protein
MILARAVLIAAAVFAGLPPSTGNAQDAYPQRWQRQFYGTLSGREVLLFGDAPYYGKLAFGDLKGTGKADLLLGKQDGSISRFENVSSARRPEWRMTDERLTAVFPGPGGRKSVRAIDAGAHAAPALADIDADGDLDLFVGTADGRLMFFRNVGTRELTVFEFVTDRFIPEGLGEYLVPFFQDVNGDGAPDLLLGTGEGSVYLLINQGRKVAPAFCGVVAARGEDAPCRPGPVQVASVQPELHAAPALVDWDGDGDLELFAGKSDGTIAYYENRGTRKEPDWRLTQRRFLAIDDGGYAAPAFQDLDGDGRADLIVGNGGSGVAVYSYKDTGKPLDAVKVTDNLLRVERFARGMERVVIASGDVDGDGDVDLILGNQAGELIWVENTGTAKQPQWKVRDEKTGAGVQRRSTAPLLVDIDGDGDLDLLVGGAEGRVWLFRNTGTSKKPNWQMETTNFAAIDVGANSALAAVDIDRDGRADLLVGNGRGVVVLYHNEGADKDPPFRLVATRLGDLSVGQAATPALLDLNDDKLPDLVVGSRDGKLAVLINGGPAEGLPRTWKMAPPPWDFLPAKGYSAPHFVDLNGDGRPDLLLADSEGNIRLYFNLPPAPQPQVATQPGGGAAPPGSSAAASGSSRGTSGRKGGGSGTTPPIAMPAPDASSGQESLLEDEEKQAQATETPAKPAGPVPPVYELATEKLGDIKVEGKAMPAFGDLDGDGDLDLVLGTGKGSILYFQNAGSASEPKFTLVPSMFPEIANPQSAAPFIADLDGDGLLDVIVGLADGKVIYFKNIGAKTQPKFAPQESLKRIAAGRGAAPVLTHFRDHDSTDLLIGNFGGKLLLYVRDGGARSLNFKLQDRRFLDVDVGVAASPEVGDLDGDGVPDLIVGSDRGALAYLVKAPTAKNPLAWKKGPDYFKGISVPAGSTPRIVDLNGDGSQDLVVGSAKGTLTFYRNIAGKGGAPEK